MRRPHVIIASVVVLYAVVMVISWRMSVKMAQKKTLRALRESRDTFANISEDAIDGVLWYSSLNVFDEVGKTARPHPIEWMQALVKRHHLQELNIVDSNGVVIASNFAREYGTDFDNYPKAAEFLKVLKPGQAASSFGQPYRPSMTDPTYLCKYYAVAFPDRSGLIQLGFSLPNLKQMLSHTPAKNYECWNIGVYGHFEGVDADGDGFVDGVDTWPGGFPPDGVMGERDDPKLGHAYTYTFPYADLLFRAVVPDREFHEQRRVMFKAGGCTLAAFMAVFAFFLIRLSASAKKLEALHKAADERRAADLAVARVIQLSSLPQAPFFRIPHLDSVFVAATYPAREVGGDFYSLFELADGRIVFLVADVSGKGVPAAMFMHIADFAFRTGFHLLVDDSTADTVAAVNNYLCEHNDAEMFVTAWVGLLDPKTGDVEYVNAGHNRPYVLRKDGRVERVDGKGGLFLGLYPRRGYRSARLHLDAGDRLFLFTDGVTEAMNRARRTYGAARLERLLATAPDDLCAAVKADVDAYAAGAERSDDLTMLALTWFDKPPCVRRTFPATEAALGEAVEFLRAEVKLTVAKQRTRLLNAADEVLANVVNYSGAAEYELAVENVPGRCRVTVSDAGAAYNPLTHADPNTHTPLADRPIGGLGILMVKKLVKSTIYRREGNRNVLALVQTDSDGNYRQLG